MPINPAEISVLLPDPHGADVHPEMLLVVIYNLFDRIAPEYDIVLQSATTFVMTASAGNPETLIVAIDEEPLSPGSRYRLIEPIVPEDEVNVFDDEAANAVVVMKNTTTITSNKLINLFAFI